MSSILELAFAKNQERIDKINEDIKEQDSSYFVSQTTYSFVACTLAEALQFGDVPRQLRFITNARKSGEGVGAGTGLPAFYNDATNTWVDFMGNAITV